MDQELWPNGGEEPSQWVLVRQKKPRKLAQTYRSLDTRNRIRLRVWDRLEAQGVARFPRPVHGRIPNFAGAEKAAARLRQLEVYRRARVIKVNPDAPQLPIREMALADGKLLYMPTPRLRAGFIEIRPERVPRGHLKRAASITHCLEYGREVPLEQVQPVELVVCGSVAVTPDGRRLGKGEGYSDLEYAVLRELGHPLQAVITTVHPLQVVDHIPVQPHDMRVDWVITPEGVYRTGVRPEEQPQGVLWGRLTAAEIEEKPVLAQLMAMKSTQG